MKHERVGGDQEGPGEEGEETRKCVYFRGKKKKKPGIPTDLCLCVTGQTESGRVGILTECLVTLNKIGI